MLQCKFIPLAKNSVLLVEIPQERFLAILSRSELKSILLPEPKEKLIRGCLNEHMAFLVDKSKLIKILS
jgi:hypothetical protein